MSEEQQAERVRVQVGDDGVAVVTLVRGEKHNALDLAMFEQIVGAAEQLRDAPGVRAVVLHGEGKSFCSGLDVVSMMQSGRLTAEQLVAREGADGLANLPQRAAFDWVQVAAPVIVAIHGNCFGGGLQIALGGDIRIAAPDARLSIMEVKWGLVPDMGMTQTLPRLMPIDRAKELTFTGRVVSGEEAASLGLVTRVAPDPLAAALELATEIAGKSPDATRRAKRLYEDTWTSSDRAAGLLLESELQAQVIGGANQIAAVTAGMSGEAPAFVDPS
jgi:enoyl-CoA hydratase/carnithine racemase